MAAVATAQVNGLGVPSLPASPAESAASSTKRKRDASDGSPAQVNGIEESRPMANGNQPRLDETVLIRTYLSVLRRYDIKPSILKRPAPDGSSLSDEPHLKRQKADGASADATASEPASASISDKVAQGRYSSLDGLVLDIKEVADKVISSLQSTDAAEEGHNSDETLSQALVFRKKALDLHRREMSYPLNSAGPPQNAALGGDETESRLALTVFGHAPNAKHLFSNLQLSSKALSAANLPNGVSLTKIAPVLPPKRAPRVPTLGELFPPAGNLPPLQAPRSTKTATKSNILSFHHPDPIEKCPYRDGQTYFSQQISAGQWIDYSNATPTSQIKTKQRERAQSLAGRKPSSTELEMSEMEALFRRAFSGFAPTKDDSAAVVSSNQVGRMWFQRVGLRQFQRLIEAEDAPTPEEEAADERVTELSADDDDGVDEEVVQEAIANWDDLIDPSLQDVMGEKSSAEKSIDKKLVEASDLIETLASYQRNRNLALPTSKNRRSTDPVHVDMLHNGFLVQQPSEEEVATYQALKNQLFDIIIELPPYAVSRLNSDKLGDLAISVRMEIRTDVCKGINDEDETTTTRARAPVQQQQPQPQPQALHHQQQAALPVATSRQHVQRTPSVSAVPPYSATHQYAAAHYSPASRPQMPNTAPVPYYQQSPVRAQASPMSHQRPPMSTQMPPQHPQHPQQPAVPQHVQHPQIQPPQHPQLPQHAAHRPSLTQPYRQPNGYTAPSPYAQQLAKSQTPYGHSNMPFPGTPTPGQQPRMPQQHPGYPHTPQAGTQAQPQQQRYQAPTPGYPAGYSHQQHQAPHQPQPAIPHHQPMHAQHAQHQHPQLPQHPASRPPYAGAAYIPNGAAGMPPRATTIPQQAQAQAQAQVAAAQQHAYKQLQQSIATAQQQQQARYPYASSPGSGGMPPAGGHSPALGHQQQHQRMASASTPGVGQQQQHQQQQLQKPGSTGPANGGAGVVHGGTPRTASVGSATGFSTWMNEAQQSLLIEQAQAEVRRNAHQRSVDFNDKLLHGGASGGGPSSAAAAAIPGAGAGGVGANAGLAGIGLKGSFDMQKQLAAASRANMIAVGGAQQQQPSQQPQQQGINGLPASHQHQQQMGAASAAMSRPSQSPVPAGSTGGFQVPRQ